MRLKQLFHFAQKTPDNIPFNFDESLFDNLTPDQADKLNEKMDQEDERQLAEQTEALTS